MTNGDQINKNDIETAFALYDTGARPTGKAGSTGDSGGDPKKWVVRNPKNGNLYPAKKIWRLACIASGKKFRKISELTNEKTGFPGLGFELVGMQPGASGEGVKISWGDR